MCDAGFRVSKVEVEFPRIEPTYLYGLDDPVPPDFLVAPTQRNGLTDAGLDALLNPSGDIPEYSPTQRSIHERSSWRSFDRDRQG